MNNNMSTISKSDLLLYIKAPLHLWAYKHDQSELTFPTPYDQHIMEQGRQIEKLAAEFVEQVLLPQKGKCEVYWQRTFEDGPYLSRADLVIEDIQAGVYDLYEIKSTTSIHKEHEYDICFQRLVCEAAIPLRHTFLLHLNPDYIRQGELDIRQLFVAENADELVQKRRQEVELLRQQALWVVQQDVPDHIDGCLKPKECPCPSLCHPNLPEYSIYDIPRLHTDKARQLKASGMLSLANLPQDFPLSGRQLPYVQAAKSGAPLIDTAAIQAELATLNYPLNFLDYETYNPALPYYDGYTPYQQMVFQYSLHVIDQPNSEPRHYEYLVTEGGDPGIQITQQLVQHIRPQGAVIVWNKTFEASRNKEMAVLYPQFQGFLLGLNERMYDLADIFSQGYYVHPDFHGSYSIKGVLPVLVPQMSYQDMPVACGDDAMLAWYRLMNGMVDEGEQGKLIEDMLSYCKLDTLAMVRCWQTLLQIIGDQ